MGRDLKSKKTVNGWLYLTRDVGNYGTDYGCGRWSTSSARLNLPQDAVYPLSEKDADGDEYDGAKHTYVMRFEKGQLPPVKGSGR